MVAYFLEDEEGICALGEGWHKEADSSLAYGNGGYILSTSSYPQKRQYAVSSEEELRSLPSLLPPSPGQEFPLAYLRAQFQSSSSYRGIQARRRPIGQTGALQRPLLEPIWLEERLQSLSIPGDGTARNSQGAGPNVIGYPRSSSKSTSRPCHFHFFRGYCKKGVNCQFSHGSVSQKYGKSLQPEGYLTENQQHGRIGCSLTSLLMELNTIRVIDREHGQYYVVLVEDAQKYMECLGLAHSCNLMDTGSGSNQIYMTFPVHSKFTEDDVKNYFNQYGPVSGVRIPYQEKRMFGFVSFVYTETVRLILSKGTAHFIRGARVLVKHYREKPELSDEISLPDSLDLY
uniref:C3H1-type domain-containing protein n=1 Tax=Leersia perrieri TaxID=77586 RepID=A0A0D9X0U3_9ORYZ